MIIKEYRAPDNVVTTFTTLFYYVDITQLTLTHL